MSMFKILFILAVTILSIKASELPHCKWLKGDECINKIGCYFDPPSEVCQIAEYELLGHRRDTFSQYMVFDGDSNCENVINVHDFSATQTFYNKKTFKSFCGWFGVNMVKVNGQFFTYEDHDGFTGSSRSAIIYPNAQQEGCVLAFSRENYRGSSWYICRPTKLNGQKIRSIMPGDNVIFSLFDREGRPYPEYKMKSRKDEEILYAGFPSLDLENLEYIRIQYTFDI